MAEFGAKHPCFKKDNATAGIVLGKLVSANLTVNLASGELYADDALDEQLSEFASGTLAMETNDLTDENAAQIYGCKVVNQVVTYNAGDTAPSGCLGYYKSLMRNKAKYYKAIFYPVVRAAIGNDNAQTKGSSINFATTQTTFTIMANANGDWRETETFDNEAAAKAWVESKCGIAAYNAVLVQCNGAEDGEGVDKEGVNYVADGGAFELNITGTPTKLYDNGVDKTSSISSNKYSIPAVSEPHTIAVIF